MQEKVLHLFLVVFLTSLGVGAPARAQNEQASSAAPASSSHMTKQTRLEIIRDFETQIAYARTAFPMGTKGLKLKNGVITPHGEELQQALALWGPAVKPGDPAHISFVRIKDDYIHFELNGGPIHKKKWYEHIQVSGSGGTATPASNDPQANLHGSFVDLYFERFVPELTAKQLRDLLYPVLDFNAKSKEEAYLDTVPPKVKAAILAHQVLVGMNTEMLVHSRGRPPKKVREKDGETDYEEWIYGEPPQDVDFVRIIGEQVVRIETMKVGGQKIVRTEKEVDLGAQEKNKEAKQEAPSVRPANAPSLRRPGEDVPEAPKPTGGATPLPPPPPPNGPQPPGPGPGGLGSGLLNRSANGIFP